MAGRTGAAFAVQLGTMQVNEEIDALTTPGISPIEFLVLLFGGMAVGVGMLDLGVTEYTSARPAPSAWPTAWPASIKASIFGVLMAIAGCLRGIQCGRSSAATSSVVTGIVLIIVSDALTTVLFNLLGL